jgi:hypothetical protein
MFCRNDSQVQLSLLETLCVVAHLACKASPAAENPVGRLCWNNATKLRRTRKVVLEALDEGL